jgi:hypothetical protein
MAIPPWNFLSQRFQTRPPRLKAKPMAGRKRRDNIVMMTSVLIYLTWRLALLISYHIMRENVETLVEG